MEACLTRRDVLFNRGGSTGAGAEAGAEAGARVGAGAGAGARPGEVALFTVYLLLLGQEGLPQPPGEGGVRSGPCSLTNNLAWDEVSWAIVVPGQGPHLVLSARGEGLAHTGDADVCGGKHHVHTHPGGETVIRAGQGN